MLHLSWWRHEVATCANENLEQSQAIPDKRPGLGTKSSLVVMEAKKR